MTDNNQEQKWRGEFKNFDMTTNLLGKQDYDIREEYYLAGYKAAQKEIEKLKKDAIDFEDKVHKSYARDYYEIASLRSQLKEAEEVIGFYSNVNNWYDINKDIDSAPVIKMCIASIDTQWNNWVGGKKARDFLEKHKREEN